MPRQPTRQIFPDPTCKLNIPQLTVSRALTGEVRVSVSIFYSMDPYTQQTIASLNALLDLVVHVFAAGSFSANQHSRYSGADQRVVDHFLNRRVAFPFASSQIEASAKPAEACASTIPLLRTIEALQTSR
jgi:uncharacterized protein YhdP